MPILSLTRQSSSLPPLGKLYKGGKKRKKINDKGKEFEIMGLDQPYFRFESQDPDAMRMFEREYGNEPTSIKIFLVHDTPEKAFQFWMEDWDGGNLIHRCDEKDCVIWRQPNGKMSTEPKPCPGGCKRVGRLYFVVPALRRFASVMLETHSIHDILQLQDNLNIAYERIGNLSEFPFLLSRRDKQITYVGDDQKPHKITKSLLYLEPQPDVLEQRMRRLEIQRIREAGLLPDTKYLTESGRTVNQNTGEILDDDDDDDDDLPVAKQVVTPPVVERAPVNKTTTTTKAPPPPAVTKTVPSAPVAALIADKVKALYEEMLDTKSQALFVTWMIERYTSKQTPNDIRHKESELIAKEISTIVSALGERHEMYFDDFKESLVAQAQESEKQQALTVPESELVAA